MKEGSLVLYKTRPALVTGFEGDKLLLSVVDPKGKTSSAKVREKDVVLLHGGPAQARDAASPPPEGDARGAWELLLDAGPVPLSELAELAWGDFTPATAWAAWLLIEDGLYFEGTPSAVAARPKPEVEAEIEKRGAKSKAAAARAAFLSWLKGTLAAKGASQAPGAEEAGFAAQGFLQDVEALALGKSDRSRTLKELGLEETPVEAHRVLLGCGAWDAFVNPWPSRYGISPVPGAAIIAPPPEEERVDLTALASYAIDNAWSDDPDDAVSLEGPDAEGRTTLWVHVADPAASVAPGSPVDVEARGKGATLYAPEGRAAMLPEEALGYYALGLRPGEASPALSFRLTLNGDTTVAAVDIVKSNVKVKRMTYGEADGLRETDATINALFLLAGKTAERRRENGAVFIDFPETHITVDAASRSVEITPVNRFQSSEMIRECMILAGEGAAKWALARRAPFPFVSQEAGEFPSSLPPAPAGDFEIRRSMRPRQISVKPGVHWGLGLDEYTQVTSPLRRYLDLLCHQQIRASLSGGAMLAEEEVLLRSAAAEAAMAASVKAERASRAHWIAVYLSGKPGSQWDGVVLSKQGSRGVISIPALGIETQAALRGGEEPNDPVRLAAGAADIPSGVVNFRVL